MLVYFILIFFCHILVTSANEKVENPPRISELHVLSNIRSRFATTLITSRVVNPANKAQEVSFNVQLPNEAFISNFTMEIDDKIIIGDVKEKEKAKQQYERAKARGQSAGLVAQRPRETNIFTITVNAAAEDKVTFNLTYQEILKRVQGVYKHTINVNPGQLVDAMTVDVYVVEKGEIRNVSVPKIQQKLGEKTNKALLNIDRDNDVVVEESITSDLSKLAVHWVPDKQRQQSFKKTGAQMVVLYDVKRDDSAGEIEVINGYFVHFFAPEGNLNVGKKHVVFVLDVSGSMRSKKIDQLKAAMKVILNDLNKDDLFNILTFSSDVKRWKTSSLLANEDNRASAHQFVKGLKADGGTNIHDALKSGIDMLKGQNADGVLASMLIFLTDGDATVGKTSDSAIIKGVRTWNNEDLYNVHCISFGSGADFSLLKKISQKNQGIARKVYADSDASLQLAGFYDEISSPLMSKLKIQYLNESVDVSSIVQDSGYTYTSGSEIVTIGKLKSDILSRDPVNNIALTGDVTGLSADGNKKFKIQKSIPCYHFCPPITTECPIFEPQFDIRRPLPCHRSWIRPPCPIRCPVFPRPKPREVLPPNSLGGFVERMWAYKTIKNMLDKANYETDDKSEAKKLKEEALRLSLKYNFVTPLTSMVVTKPDGQNLSMSDSQNSRPSRPRSNVAFSPGSPGRHSIKFGPGSMPAPRASLDSSGLPGAPPRLPEIKRTKLRRQVSFHTKPEGNTTMPRTAIRKVSTSQKHCAHKCKIHSGCRFALFKPRSGSRMGECWLSKTAYSELNCTVNEAVPPNQAALLFCINWR